MKGPGRGRLEGRACLIVGGSGGIGLASTRRFLEEGARVVVAGEQSRAGALEHAGLSETGRAWEFVLDVRDESDVERLFESALGVLEGRLDVLFHVSGISGRRFGDGSLEECSAEGWDRVMEVNARGAFLTNRSAVRVMRGQERDPDGVRGAVVNVGSVLDRSPSPRSFGTVAYSASKGAMRAMTRACAAEYAARGIRFNLIEPGLVETPMSARALGDPELQAFLKRKQPLARGAVSAEDVAEAAVGLCGRESRFVTGAVWTVDGGWSLSEGRDEIA